MKKVKRVFLAVKIQPSPMLLKALGTLRQRLKQDHIRWVKEDQLHLTLRFFGEVHIDRIETIKEAVSKAILGIASFMISIEGLGMFGSSYDPKLLWFGVHKAEEFINLEKLISQELALMGFPKDRQNFVPHLSIGRIKRLNEKMHFMNIIQDFKTEFIQESEVKEIVLFESTLEKTGATYKVIKRFDLRA